MASTGIETARSTIVEERQRLEAEIRMLEQRRDEIDKILASIDRLARSEGSAASTPTTGTKPAGLPGRVGISARIRDYLSAADQPLHIDEIMALLEQDGLTSRAKNPRSSVQTTLYTLATRGFAENVGRNRWRAL